MKFTLSWLKDHLDTKASLDEIVTALTAIGLEVEGVHDRAKSLAAFTVAHVRETRPHPDADRLQICTVETGDGVVEVVCGAPNARAGLKAVFAAEGSYIPGSKITLKPTKIRGVASCGMLCSERELELSDEHQGIIELDPDAPVGASFAQIAGLDDPVIDVAITPNRQDCLGVHGIARDLAAKGLGRLIERPTPLIASEFQSPVGVKLDFAADAADACPLFAARMVRGVANRQSPLWLAARLRAIGLRPISALVDITNYLSIDRGRPLHVYDATRLSGDLCARLGREGESLHALDDKTYAIDADMCVIADDDRVLGLGGVMGGMASGVSDATRDVVIESAYFDPGRTARTGRRTGILSDARYRFERGVDPEFVAPGLDHATAMVLELCGGAPSEKIVAGSPPMIARNLTLRLHRVEALTGVEIAKDRCIDILERLGFAVEDQGDVLHVTTSSARRDVEGEADLIEEIIRIHGLEHVPATPLPRADMVAKPTLTVSQLGIRKLRRAVAARGFHEAVTWSFLSRADAEVFGGGGLALALANPIAADMGNMRPSLLPGLLRAASRNQDQGAATIRMFEIGNCFTSSAPDGQHRALGLVMAGQSGERHWRDRPRPFDAFDAKAQALHALATLGVGVEKLQVAADAPGYYHPGQSGVLRLGPKNPLAYFGMLHPAIARQFDLEGEVAMVEILIDNIPEPRASGRTRAPAKRFALQPVNRDFAFVVDQAVEAQTLLRAARGADKATIADVTCFDVYQGPGVGAGMKSLALSVRLQPVEASFTDAEIEAIAAKIVAAVAKATGAELRR